MSLITTMDGVPLYSTKREALAWAKANGLVSYHIHKLSNQNGYMGGNSHRMAIASISNVNVRNLKTNRSSTMQQSTASESRTPTRPTTRSTAPVQSRSTVSTRSSSSSGAISSGRSSSGSRTPGGY